MPTAVRPPNEQEIRTGYLLANWRRAYEAVMRAYGDVTIESWELTEAGLIDEERLAGGMVSAPGKLHLFEACKAPWIVGAAHEVGRGILHDAGVRNITNEHIEEFAETFDAPNELQGAEILHDPVNGGYYLKIPIGGGGGR